MNYKNYVEINIDNLRSNIKYLKSKYNYDYYIMDVRNNAFNHGMYITKYVGEDIDFFYVNSFSDVQLIRKYDKNLSIIYDGALNCDNIYDLVLNNSIIVVKNLDTLKEIISLNIKDSIQIILGIDSDGNQGIDSKNIVREILELIQNKKIECLGVMAQITEDKYNEFKHIISPLKSVRLMILNNEHDKNKIKGSNAIKLDYSIYGFNDVKKKLFKKEDKMLKQVFTLNSQVGKIKKEIKNKKEKFVATVPFGYLDGMNDNIKKVWINDKLFPIIKIKDDYTLVQVDENVSIEDIVQIIGSKNSLEDYFNDNVLAYLGLFNSNLPIIYEDYTLEKTFVY